MTPLKFNLFGLKPNLESPGADNWRQVSVLLSPFLVDTLYDFVHSMNWKFCNTL